MSIVYVILHYTVSTSGVSIVTWSQADKILIKHTQCLLMAIICLRASLVQGRLKLQGGEDTRPAAVQIMSQTYRGYSNIPNLSSPRKRESKHKILHNCEQRCGVVVVVPTSGTTKICADCPSHRFNIQYLCPSHGQQFTVCVKLAPQTASARTAMVHQSVVTL